MSPWNKISSIIFKVLSLRVRNRIVAKKWLRKRGTSAIEMEGRHRQRRGS